MSGGNVAYNLRPNKFVERQIFVELLQLICSNQSPEDYVYVSLGGPQLEDHKLVHHYLRFNTLISLESDPIVIQRQRFNLRPSFVDCRQQSTGDFVANFDSLSTIYKDKSFVIWFDYASPRERNSQLIEFETLIEKLKHGDVVKITMNANILTLGEKLGDESEEIVQNRRLEALHAQLNRYLSKTSLTHEQMTNRELPRILCDTVKQAALRGVRSNEHLQPVPVGVFCYQDGHHQMLTVTVCLIHVLEVPEFRQKLNVRKWDFLPKDWHDITRINVPNLTAKERLHLEQILFSDRNDKIHSQLPFRFDQSEKKSLAILEEYARHYRRYPSYFQVIL